MKWILGGIALTLLLSPAALAQTELSMWYHGAGNEAERKVLGELIADFNASQQDWTIALEEFPQGSYNEAVVAAAVSGSLPDIIDVDGPVMPNWAWAGYLAPLTIPEEEIADFLPGAVGRWNGTLYSVGLWDAALAIFARRSVLEGAGVRIPTIQEPWTREEFDAALAALKPDTRFAYPFDVGMAWTGEWYPYAFSPFLQSFGGDIIDRSSYQTAQGVLNGDAAIAFGEWWQSLFANGYSPGTTQDSGDRLTGFTDGKYAMQWNGSWSAPYAVDAFGDDVLFLPAPDFGNGPKIGASSWQFAVSATSEHQEGANAFIRFALQDKYLARFADDTGVIPATASAAALTKNFAPGGPLEAFFALSQAQALVRPPTPAYVVAALEFEKAMADIANGSNVADTLDAAADAIDADIARNGGYGM